MAFAIDDDDRASGPSSDNDQDELMEDVDDVDAEVDADGDALLGEDEDEDEDNEEDDQEEIQEQRPGSPTLSQSQPQRTSLPNTDESSEGRAIGQPYTNGVRSTSHPQSAPPAPGSPTRASISPLPKLHPSIRPEALTASVYDIVPTMAAPQGTSINAIAATPDMRYWFTGGSDCYVRKYDGAATVNGKTLLTVAQRHPFVDTVTKAGVLMSYWENEEPISKPGDEPALSPVYSLAVNSEALWLLSGLESGCINLQSVRHDEGKRIAYLQKHTSAVSVLTLASDEKSVLSGSWDKNIFDWDLNTGAVKREFTGSGGQISAIEIRPASSLPVPEESGEPVVSNGTLSSNNAEKPAFTGFLSNGVNGITTGTNGATAAPAEGIEDATGSPVDINSLFGDTDSLFGEGDGTGAPSGGNFGADDDDEFSKAIGDIDHQDQLDGQVDATMAEAQVPAPEDADSTPAPAVQSLSQPIASAPSEDAQPKSPRPLTNGLPHAEEILEISSNRDTGLPEAQDAVATSDSTFLAAAIDGTLRVWDRRQLNPVANIPNRSGVPPWCMSACWSPDGNYIYAGRRNGTVEEFSLHKGLKGPERTFKLPAGSGAVSAVKAMPNGRHLICASHDILRLYDLKHSEAARHSTVPFLIVPGPPRAGVISALHVDPTCRYMLSAAGNRGWDGTSTEVLIGYEIGVIT